MTLIFYRQMERSNRMASSNIKVSFPVDVETVWKIVTALDDYSWRSDISNIEILNKTTFVEYTKDGFATTFTITATKPFKRWEFDMENDNIKGHWVGLFSQNGKQTTIDFTENISVKKWFLKPLAKLFLKKQQTTYVKDLEQALKQIR